MTTKEAPASNRDPEPLISSDTKDSANADQPLAHDNVPTSYTIGGNVLTVPLVELPYLKTHLRLLRTFKDLRTAVEADRAQARRVSGPTSRRRSLDQNDENGSSGSQ